jgi:type III secretion protein T
MTGGLAALLGLKTEGLFLFIALTLARPMGLAFGFIIFPWGMGQSFMLRVGFALAIGLPITIASRAEIASLAETAPTLTIALLFVKEFVLGMVLGIIASLPFLALQYAGALADSYRGDSGSGHSDPMGGSLSSWGNYFVLIGLLVFVATGGLNQLVDALYQSYATWPLSRMLPIPSLVAVGTVMDLLLQTLKSTILVAAPLIFTLMAVDLALAIGARLAQRFQIMSIEFTLKNLIAALMLPAVVAYVLKYLNNSPVNFDQVLAALRIMLR